MTTVVTATGDGRGNVLSLPVDVAVAPDGTLYVAGLGSDNGFAVSPAGQVTEVLDIAGDGTGPLADDPVALAPGPDGTLYVASMTSETLHSVGPGGVHFLGAIAGFASPISLARRGDLAFDSSGRLHVSLFVTNKVVRFEPDGSTTKIIDAWVGPGAGFKAPKNLAIDAAGRVFVAAISVFRFDDASGAFEVLIDGSGADPQSPLHDAQDVLIDQEGRLLVIGRLSHNLLRLEADGSVVQLLGPGGGGPGLELARPMDMALGDDGSIYIANEGKANILARRPDGSVELLLAWNQVYPGGSLSNIGWSQLDVDPLGRVYLARTKNHELHRLDPDGTLTLLKAQQGAEQLVVVSVEDSGAVLYGTRYPVSYVQRVEPSGASSQVLGVSGDGQGQALHWPYQLNVTGPGRFDAVGYASNNVFAVDAGFCGGFQLLPAALPGDGSGPLLTGEGRLCAGDAWLLQLSAGVPGAAAVLVLGFSPLSAPFKGGTLVPQPDVLIPVGLDGSGALDLGGPWPAGVPSGAAAWMQAWMPESPGSFRASNGLRLHID